jgi:hypothetical protein
MSELKPCLVISPIGENDSDTRKRADQVLKYIIKPAAETCGYDAKRADELDNPGLITSQVIQRVVNDPLIIADLTERNPNVFYELAILHATRKPLVQLIKKGEQLPFDVAGMRTIQVDHQNLESADTAKTEIIAMENDPSQIETPISASLNVQVLRQTDRPEERSLADPLTAVADLRAGLLKVENKLGSPDAKSVVEEVQTAINSLPSRLEEFLDSGSMRRRRFHPRILHDMLHMGLDGSREIGILVVASLYRDLAPWVYEAGLEAYRSAKGNDAKVGQEAVRQFLRVAELTTRGPWITDILGRGGKEAFIMLEELPMMLRELSDFEDGPKPPRLRTAPSKSEK